MAAVQLGFSLRTSTNVKTVHLLGSWDNYAGQLPLSKDSSKAGAWKGTFRFQGTTLRPGQRYWYYYIMDGYHVSHDPAKPSVKEPTTGRMLNTLDVPASAKSAPAPPPLSIPTGRGLSPSRIVHPKPTKHYASRGIREADYNRSPIDNVDDLTSQLELASLQRGGYSPTTSVSSGFSSGRSSGGSSPTSSLSAVSDGSDSSCRCNRYGITRSGKKVLLDCGGSKCGYSDDSSNCSGDSSEEDSEEDSSDEESEDERPVVKTVRPSASRHAQPASRSAPKLQEIKPRASAQTSKSSSSSRRR